MSGDMIQTLLRAWRQLEAYDREEDVYSDPYQKAVFNFSLQANLRVVEWLTTVDYKPFPFFVMSIPKKGGFRPKVWTTPQDGIIAQSWLNRYGVNLERHMPLESLGYRLERGEGDRIFQPWQNAYHTYQARMEGFTFLPEPCHYIKSDLSNFYPSVDLDLLESELGRYVPEPDALSLIHDFIHYKIKDPSTGRVQNVDRGVAQGPPYARVFANLYLLGLDRHLKATSLTFARYVDDFVVLYRSSEDAARQLPRIDFALEDLKLTRSIEKTKGPAIVSDGNLLFDEVLRMRSEAEDLIHGVNQLDAGAQKEMLAEGLFTYFTRVTEGAEKDLLAAAKWLSFILRNQQRVGASQALLGRTVSSVQTALEAGLQNVKTLRSIFRSLLRQGEGDLPTPGLHRVVLQSEDHAKIAFCEVCGTVDIADEVYATLASLAAEPESSFVRAAALTAFYLHRRPVPSATLEKALKQENTFLVARALLCLSLTSSTPVYPALVPYVQSEDPEVVLSTLFVALQSNDPSAHLLLRQVPAAAFRRAEVITLYVHLAVRLGRLEALNRLVAEVGMSLEAIGDILEAILARVAELPVLLGVLQEGGKLPEAIRGDILDFIYYRLEALYPPSRRPPEVKVWLEQRGQGWLQADLWLSGIRSPSIRYVSVPGQEPWSPQERIPSKRLPTSVSIETWIERCKAIYGDVLCGLRWRMEDGPTGASLVIDYAVPEGFRLMAYVLKEEGPLSYESTLKVLSRLSDFCDGPVPLDPFHILVNRDLDVRIIALGGILEPATYSGASASVDDTSAKANVRFLGLTGFHASTGVCPLMEEAELAKERSGNRLLVGSPRLEEYPHLKIIIGKCIEPDYRERYVSPQILKEDLESAKAFVNWRNSGFAVNLPLSLEASERLHAAGLHVKHMLASDGLAREGSVLHTERIVSYFLLALSKLGWNPARLWRLPFGHPGPKSWVLRSFYDVSEVLSNLSSSLASEEWLFIKRVSTCVAYWALRIEIGRFFRNVVEPNDLSSLSAGVKAAASELLTEPSSGRMLQVTLTDEVLSGDPGTLSELEQSLTSCLRTDHHRYDVATKHSLRACALLILLTSSDQRFRFEYADRNTMVQAIRVEQVRLGPNLVQWVVRRLWALQEEIECILSTRDVSAEDLTITAVKCWEAVSMLEGAVIRPRFLTHLARVKGAGEMGSYVRFLNLPAFLEYRYNHVANIDPETERPITRGTAEIMEVDLQGWSVPKVSSVLFEPLHLRTILGARPRSVVYRIQRLLQRHFRTGLALTAVFCLTLWYIPKDQPPFAYLMAALSANVLGVIIDRAITVLLSKRDVD